MNLPHEQSNDGSSPKEKPDGGQGSHRLTCRAVHTEREEELDHLSFEHLGQKERKKENIAHHTNNQSTK